MVSGLTAIHPGETSDGSEGNPGTVPESKMRHQGMKTECFIKAFVVGEIETNCYLVSVSGLPDAFLIDPGGEGGRIRDFLKRKNLRVRWIINTHGHADHIGANDDFSEPVLIHRLDGGCLDDPEKNLSAELMSPVCSRPAARLLEDGEEIEIQGLKLKVIHTPGHTPGSICLAGEDFILTGDTLFSGGVGRTDLAGGDQKRLLESIRNRLLSFPDETVIFPGHGMPSTIGQERRFNPFLQGMEGTENK